MNRKRGAGLMHKAEPSEFEIIRFRDNLIIKGPK